MGRAADWDKIEQAAKCVCQESGICECMPIMIIKEAPPEEPHVCASTTGNRCDICFGEVKSE